MEMSGSQFLPAPQQKIWSALNDPETLKACITGCERIDRLSDNEYQLAIAVKVGPVSARFKGKMSLADLIPPESYSLTFEGQGGAAGFAKGIATVSLAPASTGTNLSYTVKAHVGGKLAQIGSRLIDSAAKKIAEDFFNAFVTRLDGTPQEEVAALSPATSITKPITTGASASPNKWWPWAATAAVVVVAQYFLWS
jgi:carbon monoxide dehydrogenase subunit G